MSNDTKAKLINKIQTDFINYESGYKSLSTVSNSIEEILKAYVNNGKITNSNYIEIADRVVKATVNYLELKEELNQLEHDSDLQISLLETIDSNINSALLGITNLSYGLNDFTEHLQGTLSKENRELLTEQQYNIKLKQHSNDAVVVKEYDVEESYGTNTLFKLGIGYFVKLCDWICVILGLNYASKMLYTTHYETTSYCIYAICIITDLHCND